MTWIQNTPLFSVLVPILCAVLCMPLPARHAKRLTIASTALVCALSAGLLRYTATTGASYIYTMGHFPAPFGNELRAGPYEALMATVFALVMLCSVLGGLADIARDIPPSKANLYFVMLNMLLAAMLAMNYTNDLFTAYIFIDIITIAACSIISSKPGGRPLVATMNYLIMSLAGSALVLFSIAMLYGVTGHLLMPYLRQSIRELLATGAYSLPLFVVTAMLVAGLGIKSALFPFHSWLPDAHASATTASSAVLSGLIIKCYPVLLIKLFLRVFGLDGVRALRAADLLLLFGMAGLLWGSWAAGRQQNIKRMLSYASVSQVGLICMGIGLGSFPGMVAASYHILAHAAAKAMLFCAAGVLVHAGAAHSKLLPDLRGLGRRVPLAGVAFAVGGLSMIGIPPFSGFFSKMQLADAAFDSPAWPVILLVAVVAGTLLSVMYYIPAIVCIFSKGPAARDKPAALAVSTQIALWLFLLLNVGLGVFSQPVIRLLEQGLSVFG